MDASFQCLQLPGQHFLLFTKQPLHVIMQPVLFTLRLSKGSYQFTNPTVLLLNLSLHSLTLVLQVVEIGGRETTVALQQLCFCPYRYCTSTGPPSSNTPSPSGYNSNSAPSRRTGGLAVWYVQPRFYAAGWRKDDEKSSQYD